MYSKASLQQMPKCKLLHTLFKKKKNVKLITQYIGPKFRTPSLQNRQKFEEKFKYLKGEMELGENRIIYCQ